MAIYMIEAQEIKAQGTLAFLFSPGPDRSIDHGQNLALNQGFDTTVNYWQMAKESLVKTIDDARSDPEVAQRLFKLLVYGQQDPKYIDSIRERLSTL